MFVPKIFTTLREYNKKQFYADLISGIIVGIVALPLAIAFAIASGVSPEKGLFTAVVAGFLISALGGSRVLIGGPTGAFVVIVYGIVQEYGVAGLTIATLMAGVILMIMGFARLGVMIRFIPYPLIVGFTSGIALIIFSSQVKDFLGLNMGTVPADFIAKWEAFYTAITTINWYSTAIAAGTFFIVTFWGKITHKIPGSLIALLLFTWITYYFQLPVETIGKKFGTIPSTLPMPSLPYIDFKTIQHLVRPALTIALLGGIESLLAAVVADGMIGGNHKSNVELVGQGVANIVASLFGGIPATGAIARTATNVKNGGRTPVAGIVHSIVLLIIMLFAGQLASLIPMSCLAGILVVVAWNMSEVDSFRALLKGPRGDAAVMVITFLLTVLVDLTVAIEIGMVMAAFLFMKRMSDVSNVSVAESEEQTPGGLSEYKLPEKVTAFEISGPLFFGAAYKFKESMKRIRSKPKVLILIMRNVPVIDATGLNTVTQVCTQAASGGIRVIISSIQPKVYEQLEKSRLIFKVGKKNICADIPDAIERANEILRSEK